ncbi:imidazolonepropionase [Sneathiella chungangensis]|uniref:Imidazolonepropionase n=1 Tax=Sneathiella chungangensis TaxID=1418234 RepID=A0A845MH98_9PROT|nr:imidazolonepropionase [Sneathiella chungangensis]MZR22394.1 imidazolonepropionase [Sneathiella chungangensis]
MAKATADRLFINAHLATMAPGDEPFGAIDADALAVTGDKISWIGLAGNGAPEAGDIIDLEGRWITPGLIDCHTHLVYAGNRAREFDMSLNGATYEEIAAKGGGILSTVKATREASESDLAAESQVRLEAMMAAGVTTVEIKSGYGLDLENEVKMLEAAKHLGEINPVRVVKTFLGAHALPPEFAGDSDGYMAKVIHEMLPTIHALGLVDAVDAFCEKIAFSEEQVRQLFKAADKLNIPIKLHAEQLSNQHGAELAAHFRALSADHLEYLDERGVKEMAKAGTVAVILPGAFYYLRETQKPPIQLFRDHGVPMALATDCNPGSSPTTNPQLMMNMAAVLFRMTPEETLAGFTRNAAAALGLSRTLGTLETGKQADLAIWDIEHPSELTQAIGSNPLYSRYYGGLQ